MSDYRILQHSRHYKYSSVYSLFYSRYKENPDTTFIISLYKDSVETATYSIFFRKVERMRRYLISKGLNKGDVINIIIENSETFLVIYMAALSLGIIVCPVNYNMMPPEISFIINDSNAIMLFVDFEYLDKITSIQEKIPTIKEIVYYSKTLPGDHSLFNIGKLIDNDPGESEYPEFEDHVVPDDLAVIIYTSGTSGNPKGVILSHGNILADGEAIASWFGFSENTRTLCILPLFHNNGQIVTFLAPLWAGGSTIMIKGNIGMYSFWDIVDKYRANWTSVIPTILSVLLTLRKKPGKNSLEGIICGGALLPARVQSEFETLFNVPVYEGYGLTETTSFSCFNPKILGKRKAGSVGIPLPVNEMCIMGENDQMLSAGETGEICIRGYNLFHSYLNLPDKTFITTRNGWYHSGDYGRLDKDGFFYIDGRKDDLIIKGGENIYPREIENVVYHHPKVKDCAALGVPHPLWGEDIVMFVDLNEGFKATAEEIRKFCEDKIAIYKIPSKIFFIQELEDLNEIPKGPTKKILRTRLLGYYNTVLNKSTDQT